MLPIYYVTNPITPDQIQAAVWYGQYYLFLIKLVVRGSIQLVDLLCQLFSVQCHTHLSFVLSSFLM